MGHSAAAAQHQLAIIHHESGALVGCCGVRCAGCERAKAELGLELAPQFWGRHGYAMEVLHALAGFGFDKLGLQAVYGSTVSANFRIARLVGSLGATAATRPTPVWMSARGWTQIEWQLTRAQWKSGRKPGRSTG